MDVKLTRIKLLRVPESFSAITAVTLFRLFSVLKMFLRSGTGLRLIPLALVTGVSTRLHCLQRKRHGSWNLRKNSWMYHF